MDKGTLREKMKKILAVATALAAMFCMTLSPAQAFAASGEIEKDESVYVITDSAGAQDEVIVSDHLKNDIQVDRIKDRSDLRDIENVKGDETFKQDGDSLTWEAGGNDIYYQGKTDKEVPVTMDIKYYLDGKEVSGKDLDGKDGTVTIRIKYTNHASYNGTMVPFIAMSGFIAEDNCLTNISIDHGKVIDDGEKQIVVGMAVPGLAENLDLDGEDIGLGDSVTIKGKAKDFAVDDIMTIVTSSVFEEFDTGKLGDMNFDDEINQLDNGTRKLVRGSKLLHDGLNMLNGSMPDLETGIRQLKDGADRLNAGTQNAQKGAAALNNGIAQLAGELPNTLHLISGTMLLMDRTLTELGGQLESMKGSLDASIDKLKIAKTDMGDVYGYLTTLDSFMSNLPAEDKAKLRQKLGADRYNDMVSSLGNAKKQSKEAYDIVSGVTPGLEKLSEGLGNQDTQSTVIGTLNAVEHAAKSINTQIEEKSQELNAGLGTLAKGSKDLKDGEDRLAAGSQQLADGMDTLQEQSGDLVDGVDRLDTASLQLSKGLSKLYNDGIRKIVDLYNNDIKGLTSGLSDMTDATRNYKTFTKLPPGMKGNTKFIYKTAVTE